jgi:hypothetical protein
MEEQKVAIGDRRMLGFSSSNNEHVVVVKYEDLTSEKGSEGFDVQECVRILKHLWDGKDYEFAKVSEPNPDYKPRETVTGKKRVIEEEDGEGGLLSSSPTTSTLVDPPVAKKIKCS